MAPKRLTRCSDNPPLLEILTPAMVFRRAVGGLGGGGLGRSKDAHLALLKNRRQNIFRAS